VSYKLIAKRGMIPFIYFIFLFSFLKYFFEENLSLESLLSILFCVNAILLKEFTEVTRPRDLAFSLKIKPRH
jgi:hypothetical protein